MPQRFAFSDLREIFAKANEEKSGDPEIWMAIDRKARLPRIDSVRLKIVRFSGEALVQGRMNLNIHGVPIRVYSPMKTVADCFKYRSKTGIDPGLGALKAAIEQNKYNRQKLLRFAEICRVKKIVTAAAEAFKGEIKSRRAPESSHAPAAWDPERLRQEVWAEPLKHVARRYGVSDVTLAKHCRKLGILLPGRGYWAKQARQCEGTARFSDSWDAL
jgi:hypothetical protein